MKIDDFFDIQKKILSKTTIKQKIEQKIEKIEKYRRNNFLKISFSQYHRFNNMSMNLITLNSFSNDIFDEFQYVSSMKIEKNSFSTQY